MPIGDVLQVTCYNLTKYGDPGHFVCKYSGWGDSNCLSVAKIGLKSGVRLHDGPDVKLFILVGWDRSFRLLLGPPGLN